MPFEPGSVVADYEVIRSLGEGAVAEVYLVKHRVTGRLEAMKVLHRRGLADQRVDRFLREIKLQAGLSHPNIAAVRTALEVDGELLMIMEYVDGQSLRTIIEKGRPPAAATLDYILQALSALEYAHGHKISHRDVTPSNMLVSPKGRLKLTDFGLAKAMGNPSLTQTGTPLGSLFYMSPEHVRGVASADHRSDLYSIGAVLYELVTGSPPFQGNNAFLVMRAQVDEQPRRPSELVRGLHPGVEDVLLRALQKDPDKRFASAGEMRQALAALQKEVQSGWTGPTAADNPAPLPVAADEPKSLSRPRPTRLLVRMKQPQWWAPALGAALALLLLAVWIGTRPREVDTAQTPVDGPTESLAKSETPPPPPTIVSVDQEEDPSVSEEEQPQAPTPAPTPLETAKASKTQERAAARVPQAESSAVAVSRDSPTPANNTTIAVSGQTPEPVLSSEAASSTPTPAATRLDRESEAGTDARNVAALARSGGASQPRLLQTLRVPRLSALTVSADGALLAGSANDQVVHVWNPGRGQGETLFEGHLAPVTALTFGPERRLLASGDRNGVIKVWDLDSGREVAALTQKGAVQFVAFSRDGAWMATGSSDESVGLWKRGGESGPPHWERAMKGHRQPPLAVAFSPDGTRVVTSSDEKFVHIWPVLNEGKPERIDVREGGANALTFSPDGRWLAAASGTSLTIWDASHLARARQVDIPEGRHVMAFSPSGLCLVASATFRTLRVWEATTGQELAVLDTDVRVEQMTITPDGDRLVVADAKGGMRVWQIPVPDAATLRAQSTLPPSFEESAQPATGEKSEAKPLGIFRHVVDVFR